MPAVKRIQEIIKHYNMNVSAFEKFCGLSNNTIRVAMIRETFLKEDTILKILKAFPEINPLWFLYGKGSMFIEVGSETNEQEGTVEYKHEHLHRIIELQDSLLRTKDELIKELKRTIENCMENSLIKTKHIKL